jgi:hypothetical protein
MGARLTWLGFCRVAAVIATLVLPVTWSTGETFAGGDAAPEYQIKAAFIVNFPKFVEWPADRMPPPGAPFVIAVLGADPFGSFLREAIAGKSVAGHPIEIRRVGQPADAINAHLVYIAQSERPRLADILRALEPASVLTVSDAEGFAAAGVIVNLYLDERRVRLEVNQSAAVRSGLRLSAQLLGVARIVGGGA